jgi:hypothetical protein
MWQRLTATQRLDQRFILAAIQQSPTLPSKSDFERTFPQSLRFDRTIVLSFARRDDFVELYHERHLFVPECCTDDFEIMLEYCKKIPRSLQDVKWDSLPTRNVKDLIRAALLLDGMELQYVPLDYQEEFFEFAILQNGKAVRLCPSNSLMEKVAASREIMLKVVASCGSMLKRASIALQQDEALVLTAVCQGGLDFKLIPKKFQTDNSFLEQAISQRADLFLQLSSRPTLQASLCLCLAAVLSPTSTPDVQIAALAHQKEAIWQNRAAVLAMALRGDIEVFAETLQGMMSNPTNHEHALAQGYVNDLEIVRAAVERNGKLLFTLASEQLQTEVELVISSIQEDTAWNTLRCIPQTLQIQHPEITLRAIEIVSTKHLNALPSHIPEALWASHRPLIRAWIRRGAPILFVFNNLVANDMELALDLAKYNWQEFRIVRPTLLSDRDFMLRAVQEDGRVLQFAATALKQDFGLCVYAVANNVETLRCMARTTLTIGSTATVAASTASTTSAKGGWIPSFRHHVASQLDLYQIFVTDFLRGICCTASNSRMIPPPAKRCPLQLLDRGTETTQAWKRLIAMYLGVPVGQELKLLRRCQCYLQQYDVEQQSSTSNESPYANNNAMGIAHHQHRNRFAAAHRAAAEHAWVRWRFAPAVPNALEPRDIQDVNENDQPLDGLQWERLENPLEDIAAFDVGNDPLWDEMDAADDVNLEVRDGAIVHHALRMAQQAMLALDMVQNRMEEDLMLLDGVRPNPQLGRQHRLHRDEEDNMLLEE